MKNLIGKIYSNLKKVPKGKITTYKELAKSINSKAYRYVGTLMKTNKNPNKIPCFKVVKSNGNIGEYASGKKEKINRLNKENIKVKNNKIINFKKVLYKFK
tara:strand:+ start:3823 stop:4125 length:303 start_codon:yes stop_codon:yes gene_type:complete